MRTRTTTSPGDTIATRAARYGVVGNCTTPFGWVAIPGLDIVGSMVTNYESVVFTDVVTSGFEKIRDHGGIVNSPMSKVHIKTTREPVTYTDKWSKTTQLWCGPVLTTMYGSGSFYTGTLTSDRVLPSSTYPATPTIDSATVQEVAVTAAFANANEADLAALEMVAESKETVQSLLQIAGRIIRLVLAIRKGQFRRVWKEFTPKELADRWMEGRYAIRPLVYDIFAIARLLNTQSTRITERQTYRGSSTSGTVTASDVRSASAVAGSYQAWGRWTTTREVSARSGVLAKVEAVRGVTALGLDQPFDALWELTTMSFVIDWFFNIGETIASWTPKLGITALASWVTVLDTVVQSKVIDHVVDTYPTSPPPYERVLALSGGLTCTTTMTKTRMPSPARAILPNFVVRLDAAKLLDLMIMIKKLVN